MDIQNLEELLPFLSALDMEGIADVEERSRSHQPHRNGDRSTMKINSETDLNDRLRAMAMQYIEGINILPRPGENDVFKDNMSRNGGALGGGGGINDEAKAMGLNVSDKSENLDSQRRTLESSTPLHLAAGRGNAAIVQMLIEHGGNIDALDTDDWTPLIFAVQSKDLETVRVLLSKGANVDKQANDGRTALHMCCQPNRYSWDMLQLILDYKPNINVLDERGRTPAFLLAQDGEVKAMQALEAAGGDMEIVDFQQVTMLHLAAANPRVEVAEWLAKKMPVDSTTNDGITPLMLSCTTSNVGVVNALLELGADARATSDSGWRPLHYTVQDIQPHTVEIVQTLLSHGANPDDTIPNGATALIIAAQEGETEVITALLKAGADPSVQAKDGRTALIQSVNNGHIHTARQLKEAGASMNAVDKDGDNVLHIALRKRKADYDLVAALLELGVDPNARSTQLGLTPLHIAAATESPEICQLLLDHGALP